LKKIYLFYKDLIYQNRNWLYFIVTLAVIWAVAGFFLSASFPELFPRFVEFMNSVFEQALGALEFDSDLDLALALFRQNMTATLYDLFFGLFFGIVPVLSIALNFFALGFLSGPIVSTDPIYAHITIPIIFLSVAPHGIFEIPAIFLASAFGFRFGWAWFLPSASGKRWTVFKQSFFDVLKILPLIFVLLVFAAVIEAFVTGRLLGV